MLAESWAGVLETGPGIERLGIMIGAGLLGLGVEAVCIVEGWLSSHG